MGLTSFRHPASSPSLLGHRGRRRRPMVRSMCHRERLVVRVGLYRNRGGARVLGDALDEMVHEGVNSIVTSDH